jgi:hypothetical protein
MRRRRTVDSDGGQGHCDIAFGFTVRGVGMPIAGVSVEHFGPGTLPAEWYMGDYMLVSAGVWKDGKRGPVPLVSRMIQIAQGLRYRGDRSGYAHWNHAVWVSSDCLFEALAHGVTKSPYEKYRDVEFHVVHSNLNEVERVDADAFVRYEHSVHAGYGTLQIVSIALSLLTGLRFSFGMPGTAICSGLVAAALAAPQWREDPSHVMPADLAAYAEITG